MTVGEIEFRLRPQMNLNNTRAIINAPDAQRHIEVPTIDQIDAAIRVVVWITEQYPETYTVREIDPDKGCIAVTDVRRRVI